MSTINITDALTADAKIRASAMGDTILFQNDLQLAPMRNLPGDRIYKSATGSRIRGMVTDYATFGFNGVHNLELDLILDDANVNIKSSQNVHGRFDVRNLKARPGPESRHAIFVNQIRGGSITGIFHDMLGADTCIFGYDTYLVNFNDGRFFNVHEGIHISWFKFDVNDPHNNNFLRNVIEGIRRHGIELQGGPCGLNVKNNHVSKRIANGINLSIATGGDFNGPITYDHTARIEVDDNVLDNTGFAIPDPSQCMGIEIMGRFKCRRNIIVNGGQGIAYTYNPSDAEIIDNKFKATARPIVTDPPHDQAKTPINSGNDLNYTGAVPNAADTVGSIDPDPTPPPSKMKISIATAYTSFVRVVCEGANSGNTVLQWRGGDGIWKDDNHKITTLPVTVDVAFDPVKYKSWWLWFRLLDSVGPSAETKANAQLGVTADPTPIPPPPLKFTYLPNVPIKRSDGTTVPHDVPFGDTGQPDYTKAKPSA